MTRLIYINISNNRLQGNIVLLEAAQSLEGLQLSSNNFIRFPWDYFVEDKW